MDELLSDQLEEAKMAMDEAIDHLKGELSKIRTGKASPAMLQGLMVSYYGAPTPLQQVGSVTTTDSRTLSIKPFDKSAIGDIERAIFEANLGVTPQNNGESIMINIPPLTTERRQMLAKQVKAEGEKAKVSIRNDRREAMDAIKKEVKGGFPEDAGKRKEEEVEAWVKGYYAKVDEMVDKKSTEVTTL